GAAPPPPLPPRADAPDADPPDFEPDVEPWATPDDPAAGPDAVSPAAPPCAPDQRAPHAVPVRRRTHARAARATRDGRIMANALLGRSRLRCLVCVEPPTASRRVSAEGPVEKMALLN